MITEEQFLKHAMALENYHGIFAKLWRTGKPVADSSIKTACVKFDKEGNCLSFCFNPEFYNSLDEYNRLFIICHEMLHLILNHGMRLKNKDIDIANYAMDVVVNESLIKGFGFDKTKIKDWDEYIHYDSLFEKENIIYEKDRSFEYYYELLNQYTQQKPQSGSGQGKGGPGGKEKSDGTGAMDKLKTVDDHESMVSDDQNSINQFVEESIEGLTDDETKNLVDKVKKEIEEIQNGRGTMAGGLEKLMDVTTRVKRKKKWESVIKKWIDKNLKQSEKIHDQWTRKNRRFSCINPGFFIPTEMDSDEINDEKTKITVMFFLDTSGSCSHLASRFWNAAKSIPPERFNILLHCFDTRVFETSLKSGKLYGFGGTSFSVIEQYIQNTIKSKKIKRYPSAVFVITDGMGDAVTPQYPERWYWFLSENHKYCIPATCNIFSLDQFE